MTVLARRPSIARSATAFGARRANLAMTARVDRSRRRSIADLDPTYRARRLSVAATGPRQVARRPSIAEVAVPGRSVQVIPIGETVGLPYTPTTMIPGLVNAGLVKGFYSPWVSVRGPAPSTDLQSIDWTRRINGGWSATLVYRGKHQIEFGDETPFRITVNDGTGFGGITEEFPVMIAEKREHHESFSGPTTTYELVDRASWKLSRGGGDLPTFFRTDAQAIIRAVAAAWDVRIQDGPNFPLIEEDVADSDGWAPLLRLAAVSAMNVLVTPQGTLRFVDCRSVSSRVSFRCSDISLAYVPSLSYTGMSLVKTSSLAPGGVQHYTFDTAGYASFALKSPIKNVIARDVSARGGLGYLGLWSGSPSSPGSRLIQFFLLGSSPIPLNVPVGGRGQVVTHATVVVYPTVTGNLQVSAALDLIGAPPEPDHPGTERAFAMTHGSGRKLTAWEEQLLPSRAYCQARLPKYLWEASKSSRPLNYSGRLDLRLAPTVQLQRPGYPANRAESVSHSLAVGSLPTTSVQAVCL